MRLSNAQKLLLLFFLINSLTLLLKPTANAQTAALPKVFAYNDYHGTRLLFKEPADTTDHTVSDIPVYDQTSTGVQALTRYNFTLAPESPPGLMVALYRSISNSSKTYMPHPAIRTQLYSADLGHSARITIKLFKVVIRPLRHRDRF